MMKLSSTFFKSLLFASSTFWAVGGVMALEECFTPFSNEWFGYLQNNCQREDAESGGLEDPCCFATPPLIRISATQAFDAYQSQTITGYGNEPRQGVLVIDVRTPEEVYWVGQVAQVSSVDLKDGSSVVPDFYKTVLQQDKFESKQDSTGKKKESSWSISFTIDGEETSVPTDDIDKITTKPFAFNAPVEYRDVEANVKTLNPYIGSDVMSIVQQFNPLPQAVIFYCRSGQRSTIGCYYGYCTELFQGFLENGIVGYEVELSGEEVGSEINGNGGFEGSSYSNRFNGYRGFPGRMDIVDEDEVGNLFTNEEATIKAADFKDAGLPITIGKQPMTPENFEETFTKPWACEHDANVQSSVCNPNP